jgi:TetR/AcrR family transcriptional regulator, fatty acid metabolism regulator protein
MNKENIILIKSGGRRIELYAELGKYFLPTGSLNEPVFRKFLLKELSSKEDPSDWLSVYLDRVLSYLEEKGMGSAAISLLEAALDESAKMGTAKVAISPEYLKKLLSLAQNQNKTAQTIKDASQEKRNKIFEAALKVFGERGFYEATMDEVAARAGVAKGTLYRNFKSKDDLFDSLLLESSNEIVERLSKIFIDDSDVLEQAQQFIEEWVGFIEENHVLYKLIQTEGNFKRSGSSIMFYEYLVTNLPMLKERIVSMNINGQLKSMSFYSVTYGMLGFIDGVVHKWFRSNMDYPLSDEIPLILEVLFNGFTDHNAERKIFFCPPEDKQQK